jgi:hypothetical protein
LREIRSFLPGSLGFREFVIAIFPLSFLIP